METEKNTDVTTNETVSSEPIINEEVPKKPNFFKTPKGLLVVSFVVFSLITFGILFSMYNAKQEKIAEFEAYKEDFVLALSLIQSESESGIDVLGETRETWREAIYEDDVDFNTALMVLYAGYHEDGTIETLKTGRETIDGYMDKLQDVHSDFDMVYLDLLDLYTVYSQIQELAVDPTGSYNTFSETTSDLENEFSKSYNRVKVRVPNKMKED